MISVNKSVLKSKISHYLRLVAGGERITICDHNVPIAEIVPIRVSKSSKRPIGLYQGLFDIPDEVFCPLNAEEIKEYFGDSL